MVDDKDTGYTIYDETIPDLILPDIDIPNWEGFLPAFPDNSPESLKINVARPEVRKAGKKLTLIGLLIDEFGPQWAVDNGINLIEFQKQERLLFLDELEERNLLFGKPESQQDVNAQLQGSIQPKLRRKWRRTFWEFLFGDDWKMISKTKQDRLLEHYQSGEMDVDAVKRNAARSREFEERKG